MDEPLIKLSEAYKIADRVSTGWKIATFVVSVIAGVLLYTIYSMDTAVYATTDAKNIKASQITSEVNIKE